MGRAVGVDVGGTKMLCVVIDPDDPHTVLATERMATPRGTEAVLAGLVSLVEAVDPAGDGPVGVGIPGLVDERDHFLSGPNLPGVVDLDLGGRLGEQLGRAVVADNDATCATLAEFTIGAGSAYDHGLLLTIGTGIGGGLVTHGRVYRGSHGFAAEMGHMMVDPAGPRCPCGRRGCWERFASGSGLGRLGRDAAVAGRLTAAVELAGGDVEAVRGEHVMAAARAADPDAAAVLDEFAWWLAAGIANLVDILDPSVVVLGGGVMSAADLLIDRVRAAVPGQVMGAELRPTVDIVEAALGESAGAVGAALAATGL